MIPVDTHLRDRVTLYLGPTYPPDGRTVARLDAAEREAWAARPLEEQATVQDAARVLWARVGLRPSEVVAEDLRDALHSCGLERLFWRITAQPDEILPKLAAGLAERCGSVRMLVADDRARPTLLLHEAGLVRVEALCRLAIEAERRLIPLPKEVLLWI